jgi:hypothetical protein
MIKHIDDYVLEMCENYNITYDTFSILKIYVNPFNRELYELYKTHIENHNHNHNIADSISRFSLFLPEDIHFSTLFNSQLVDFQVKVELIHVNTNQPNKIRHSEYIISPHSSLCKTSFLFENNTETICSDYCGNLKGKFRLFEVHHTQHGVNVKKYTKVLQIVHSTETPIFVLLVENENELINYRLNHISSCRRIWENWINWINK